MSSNQYQGTHNGQKKGKTFQAPGNINAKIAKRVKIRQDDFDKNLIGHKGYVRPGSQAKARS